ncbi:MAG: 4-alpha-glucanotransferase, partial [Bacteroidota bacterium]
MQFQFYIHYQTNRGQRLVLQYWLSENNAQPTTHLLDLSHSDSGWWTGVLSGHAATEIVNYRYILMAQEQIVAVEYGKRQLHIHASDVQQWIIRDSWRIATHPDNALWSSAFRQIIFQPPVITPSSERPTIEGYCTFRLRVARVQPHQQPVLLGSSTVLSQWNRAAALPMSYLGDGMWSVTVPWTETGQHFYKYGIADRKSGDLLYLEAGADRELYLQMPPQSDKPLVLQDEHFRHPSGHWKGTGMAIPVFSIRTQKGLGIGEFSDLKMLVDWVAALGMNLIQILPINDTHALNGWVDSYPYKAISVFALHPIYLNIEEIEGFEEIVGQAVYDEAREQLNAQSVVAYEAVLLLKMQWARQLFSAQAQTFLARQSVQEFISTQAHWLRPYAAFCYLRDTYQTANFEEWKTHGVYDARQMT